MCRLTNHPDLLAVRPDECSHDHRYDRFSHILGKHLLDVARKRARVLSHSWKIVDQRHADFSVRTDRHGVRQIWITPNDDVQLIAWADDVVVVRRGGDFGCGRLLGGTATS